MWVVASVAFLVAAFAAGWVACVALALRAFGQNHVHPRPFDAELWHDPEWRSSMTNASGSHSIRQRMVDDLLATRLWPGMTREAVLELIGPPDEDPYFREPDPDAWICRLGIERGLGVDNEWLFVSFDADERVSTAFLARD